MNYSGVKSIVQYFFSMGLQYIKNNFQYRSCDAITYYAYLRVYDYQNLLGRITKDR